MSKRIPNYALYGQAALPAWQDLLHLEWINERGDMHQREIKPHQHDSLLQIVYVRSGEGEVSLENKQRKSSRHAGLGRRISHYVHLSARG